MAYPELAAPSLAHEYQALLRHCASAQQRCSCTLQEQQREIDRLQAEVQRLRAEGEALHKGGDHAESMRVLKQALDLLQGSE